MRRLAGIGAAGAGAACWGLSGTAGQLLFERGITPQWLTAVRLLLAGLLLLVVFRPAPPQRAAWRGLVGSGLGLASAQYCFFASVAASNVAVAAFIQYLSAPLIVGIEAMSGRRRPPGAILLAALAGVLSGAALLLLGRSRGDGGLVLHVSPAGVIFGLACAVSITIYTLVSRRPVRELGAWRTTAWASLVGAVPLLVWTPPWTVHYGGSGVQLVGLVAFVTVVGTLLGTGLYLASLSLVTAGESGVASTLEAVSAALSGFLVLGIGLSPQQYVGGALILAAVPALTLQRGAEGPA
ncbi:MAG TPA: DMT family transporter [Candidatus Eisenbacteria bacterium]|nr:DMT family transporter [Candidatus Eisenbacteria bacterium]